MTDAAKALSRARPRSGAAQFTAPAAGRVRRLDPAGSGQLMVTVDVLGDTHLVGPCRWARPDSEAGVPPAGTRCLVAFAGGLIAHPWIVAFDRWPA